MAGRDKMLLDPYAKSVFFPPAFDQLAAARPGSNAGKAPLGVLTGDSERFDWQGDQRPRHEADTVIYELHVGGFTRNPNSGVRDQVRGTFAGLAEKIPYLKDLGVIVVELMPVFQYDPSDGNYWGYMPLNFFSPHHGYLSDHTVKAQHNEVRDMIKALHQADIEVVLDVVYNHTGEGDHTKPGRLGQRQRRAAAQRHGLRPGTGAPASDRRALGRRRDVSIGPGVSGDHGLPVERQIPGRSPPLRQGRSRHGTGPDAPPVRQRRSVPRRSDERLSPPSERQLPRLARRIHALRSGGLQPEAELGERPRQYGRHGEKPQLELRLGRRRGRAGGGRETAQATDQEFLCLLFLSNGTPMFRAGDEFMHTQAGNNNPYNQDNATGWIDWGRLHANPDVFRFFKRMIAFRKAHPSLARSRFWREDVRWCGVGDATDLTYDFHSLAFALHGGSHQDLDIYVMINAYWEELTFQIQEGAANAWRRVIDTSLESPFDFLEPGNESPMQSLQYRVPSRAVVVLVRDQDGGDRDEN